MMSQAGFSGVVSRDLREVRRGVAEASDAQVLMVVRMVDALGERGATDAVLAPVRERLRMLQPPRPLRFARLLFMPLDPLIVAPAKWRPGTLMVPRSAIFPLARAVRAVMSADSAEPRVRHSLAEIDALIADATTADDDRVRGAGALLWEAAAYAFRALGGTTLDAALRQACQAQWSAAGLPAAELPSLLSALSAIMGVALSLHDRDHRAIGLAEQELADVLVRTEAEGARAWGMMLSLLVIRLPEASDALLTVAQRNRNNRPAAQAAVDSALAWVEAEADEPPCVLAPEAASALNRQAMLLETLAGKTPDPQHKRRLSAARTKLAASALQRYESCVQVELCESLSALPAEPEALAAQLEQVEMTARMLRAFELEARRLGNAPQFDKIIEQTSARVQQAPGLSLMDRARLMEIIAGTDAALRILNIK